MMVGDGDVWMAKPTDSGSTAVMLLNGNNQYTPNMADEGALFTITRKILPIKLVISNKSGEIVQLYKVQDDGTELENAALEHGQGVMKTTFAGHKWRAKPHKSLSGSQSIMLINGVETLEMTNELDMVGVEIKKKIVPITVSFQNDVGQMIRIFRVDATHGEQLVKELQEGHTFTKNLNVQAKWVAKLPL